MRVILFTNTFPPEFGAASSRLAAMVQGLKKGGFEVEVITGHPHYPFGKIYPSYQNKYHNKVITEQIDGITVHRYPVYASHDNNPTHRLLTMLSLALSTCFAFLKVARFRPDFIFVQFPPILLPFTAFVFAKIFRARLVLNVSDLWPSAIYDLKAIRKGFLYRLLDSYETFIFNRADIILAQSIEIIEHIYTKKKYANPLLYRTGVDCEVFKPKPNSEKTTELRLVYAGVLGLAHGLFDLCNSFDFKALGVSLSIYGDGFEKNKILQIPDLADRNIFVFEAVSPEKVATLLTDYDAMLVVQKTYLRGTVPAKIYEAMAVGLPIFFHGAGEGARIIIEANAGWVSAPNNTDELNKNIQFFTQMSMEERAKIGANGRMAAETKYDRKLQIQALIKHLENYK